MEIGGDYGLEAMKNLGAVEYSIADAGHSGYTAFYHAGDREDMIELTNYRQYGEPHSVDCIVSSRVFDIGSGVGDIAEPWSTHEHLHPDELGEFELSLVMDNLLKKDGFMIHYDGYLHERSRMAGNKPVCRIQQHESTWIYRYHPDQNTLPEKFAIGRKSIEFNQESQTWERKVSEHQ